MEEKRDSQHPPPLHFRPGTDIVHNSGVVGTNASTPPPPPPYTTISRSRKLSEHEIARGPLTRGSPVSQRISAHSGGVSSELDETPLRT
ncbi:hypothetical protein EVAR_89430_1 [Eumeta japonica]|uniref:Uncharacterized protein n=1 Tax=Eumeta variegata TaxID=151549 RepID=A0A4C1Z041_EUMVA|nr:hypothetical protein EVAR_89430_1 [Eumeta japonica]